MLAPPLVWGDAAVTTFAVRVVYSNRRRAAVHAETMELTGAELRSLLVAYGGLAAARLLGVDGHRAHWMFRDVSPLGAFVDIYVEPVSIPAA